MKKVLLFLSIIFICSAVFSQAVNDKAVIPVSVNLNEILRLNIVSGGNIEFTFNTITDYNSGKSGTQYQTVFAVTSSVDYDVAFASEAATMTGTDNGGTISSGYVALAVTDNSSGATVTDTWQLLSAITAGVTLIDEAPAGAASANDNKWVVSWECGTPNTTGAMLGLAADRYAVNTFITISTD